MDLYSPPTDGVFSTLLMATCGVIILLYLFKPLKQALIERRKGLELKKEIDGPHPHWLFGHLNLLKPNQHTIEEICKRCKDFPKIGQVWFGPFLSYIMLHHPHVLKPILTISEQKDRMAYRFIKPWIGDGLLVSSGKKWHRNRHLLTKAFHFEVLREYTKVFNCCSETFLKKLDEMKNTGTIEVFEHVSLMTLDGMLQCAISCKTNCQTFRSGHTTETPEHKYISAVYDLTTLAMKRIFNPLYHNDFIYSLTPSGRKFKSACDYIHTYDEKVIRERRQNILNMLKQDSQLSSNIDHIEASHDDFMLDERTKNSKHLDFLDILLSTRDEDGKGLTEREIRDEVDTFLFEGHDTTASCISWALYCLADNPQHQERCRDEVVHVLQDRAEVLWGDLHNMPYLTMFIKEVLRLYPPVFAIARTTSQPVTFDRGFRQDQHCLDDKPGQECGITLESSTNIGIPLMVLHRNETVWKNPTVFDPSRFDKENSKPVGSFAYLPFSAGPRNCIGQNFAMAEMKVVLAKALQKFKFYLDDECSKPEMLPMIVLKSKNGIHVKVQKIV